MKARITNAVEVERVLSELKAEDEADRQARAALVAASGTQIGMPWGRDRSDMSQGAAP